MTDLVPPTDSLVLAVDHTNLHNRIPVLGTSSYILSGIVWLLFFRNRNYEE